MIALGIAAVAVLIAPSGTAGAQDAGAAELGAPAPGIPDAQPTPRTSAPPPSGVFVALVSSASHASTGPCPLFAGMCHGDEYGAATLGVAAAFPIDPVRADLEWRAFVSADEGFRGLRDTTVFAAGNPFLGVRWRPPGRDLWLGGGVAIGLGAHDPYLRWLAAATAALLDPWLYLPVHALVARTGWARRVAPRWLVDVRAAGSVMKQLSVPEVDASLQAVPSITLLIADDVLRFDLHGGVSAIFGPFESWQVSSGVRAGLHTGHFFVDLAFEVALAGRGYHRDPGWTLHFAIGADIEPD